jgi:hypothetical protein
MAPTKKKATKQKAKEQFTVEPIDIDGDNIPDGDLVTKYVNGKVVSRKFVQLKKLEAIADGVNTTANASSTNTRGANKFVYKQMPNITETEKPVLVQDSTGFAQYMKMGAGLTAGQIATTTVFDGLKGLFTSE